MAYGYKKRYGGRKAYRKSSRYGKKGRKFGRKMKVPGGMKMVPSASYRSGGAYSTGQNAGHELKYLDSSLYNTDADGTNPATFNVRTSGNGAINPSGTNTSGAYLGFDNSLTQAPVLLNNPITGTDATQRLGRKINIRSYLLRVVARLTDEAAASGSQTTVSGVSQCARIVVVWDKQPNGSLPAAQDVFTDVSAVAAGDPQAESAITSAAVMQLNNRDRFVVLSDDRCTLSSGGTSCHTFEIRRNVNLETVYSAIAPSGQAGIAQIASGSLLAFFLGEYPKGIAGPAANPASVYAVSAMARIRFYDA